MIETIEGGAKIQLGSNGDSKLEISKSRAKVMDTVGRGEIAVEVVSEDGDTPMESIECEEGVIFHSGLWGQQFKSGTSSSSQTHYLLLSVIPRMMCCTGGTVHYSLVTFNPIKKSTSRLQVNFTLKPSSSPTSDPW